MVVKVFVPTNPSERVSVTNNRGTDKVAISNQRGPLGPTGPIGPFGPKSVTISYPTASENLTLMYTDQSVTVEKISAVLAMTEASNAAFTIKHSSDRSSSGTEVVTGGMFCTSNTSANTVTTFDSATIPANTFVWFETSSITGSVQEFHLTIEFE